MIKSKLYLSKARAAFLLIALTVACGDSSTEGVDANDGGGALEDGGDGAQGGDSADGGDATQGGNSNDGDNLPPLPVVEAGAPVRLGTAIDFAILAKSGISTEPTSSVTGDIGVSPAAATYITGFSLMADATNLFATSTQVTGKVYAANYKSPSPAKLTTAVIDMGRAFTDAASRAPDMTELGAGKIGGMTLAPGVYKWGTGVTIPTDLTLNGSATDVWIFQIAQGLTMSSATKVVMAGGALAKNVFWQVGGAVELGTTAHLEGVVLSKTAITLKTGASVNGRLLAQTAVRIASSKVVQP